jgi:hypothetical protein
MCEPRRLTTLQASIAFLLQDSFFTVHAGFGSGKLLLGRRCTFHSIFACSVLGAQLETATDRTSHISIYTRMYQTAWNRFKELHFLHSARLCSFNAFNSCTNSTYPKLQHSEILHSAHSVYLCGPYGSHNKKRLFPQTALTGWAL